MHLNFLLSESANSLFQVSQGTLAQRHPEANPSIALIYLEAVQVSLTHGFQTMNLWIVIFI